jgi:ankyrin repeat protein
LVTADPGCGKSVLSKSLIGEELKSHESRSTCYFFFKDNDEQNSLKDALCSLLHQLFSYRPHLLSHAIPSFNRNGPELQTETAELWQILLQAATDPNAGDVVCILDALDECAIEGQANLSDLLTTFYNSSRMKTSRLSTLKFLVTSRPYSSIERRFHKISAGLPTIRLAGEEENDQISIEIDAVIDAWVSDLSIELNLKPSLRDLLQVRLHGIRHRTYLWLYLVFRELRESSKQTRRKFTSIIDEIPKSVDEAYERILNKSIDQNVATVLLKIIVGAARPLTLKEMDIALALATQKEVSSYEDLDLDGDKLKTRIRNLCGLFVYIADSRVHLFHQTAKEFLLRREFLLDRVSNVWRHSLEVRDCEFIMAGSCMRYLLFDGLETNEDQWLGDLETNVAVGKVESPALDFVAYSAVHWPEHFRKADVGSSDQLFSSGLTLFNPKSGHYHVWRRQYWISRHTLDPFFEPTSLQLAALSGITEAVRHLLDDEKSEADSPTSDGSKALEIAAMKAHLDVVQLLLDRRADIGLDWKDTHEAFRMAVYGNHKKVAQLLIERGVGKAIYEMDREDSPLYIAAFYDREQIVEQLLRFITQIDDQEVDPKRASTIGAALERASLWGHEKVVKLLLHFIAQTGHQLGLETLQPYSIPVALEAASEFGHKEVVKQLLNFFVETDDQVVDARWSLTIAVALPTASREGRVKVVELLLANGGKMIVQKEDAKHASVYALSLWQAAYRGHNQVVELLLEQGTDLYIHGACRSNIRNAVFRWRGEWKEDEQPIRGTRKGYRSKGKKRANMQEIIDLLLEKGRRLNALQQVGI